MTTNRKDSTTCGHDAVPTRYQTHGGLQDPGTSSVEPAAFARGAAEREHAQWTVGSCDPTIASRACKNGSETYVNQAQKSFYVEGASGDFMSKDAVARWRRT
jgi:hypothetical protein